MFIQPLNRKPKSNLCDQGLFCTTQSLLMDSSPNPTAILIGFPKLLLIGGGKTNASFLHTGLIDEIALTTRP